MSVTNVPLVNKVTGRVDFVVAVYGLPPRALQIVPPLPVVSRIAKRFPNHSFTLESRK